MNKKSFVIIICTILIGAILPVSGAVNEDIKNVEKNSQTMDDYFEIPTMVDVIFPSVVKNQNFGIRTIGGNNQVSVEIDFTSLYYGEVLECDWYEIEGDLDMATYWMPTIRNIGSVPVYIKIMQNDMGFGKTFANGSWVWNVEFGCSIGSESIEYYYPEEQVQLPKILDVGETTKLEFHIHVLKGYPGNYNGMLWLSAVDATNIPPDPPEIKGTKKGTPKIPYVYVFTAEDPDFDDVSYYINWGDGEITDWTPLQASGTSYVILHRWEEGSYLLQAKAKDSKGAESPWTEYPITMPRYKITTTNLLMNLLKSHPNAFPILREIIRMIS